MFPFPICPIQLPPPEYRSLHLRHKPPVHRHLTHLPLPHIHHVQWRCDSELLARGEEVVQHCDLLVAVGEDGELAQWALVLEEED